MNHTRGPEKVSPTDPRPPYFEIGVDADGAHHVYRTKDAKVLVIYNRAIQQRVECEGHVIDDYVAHVKAHAGWQALRYGREAFVERLARTVGDAR